MKNYALVYYDSESGLEILFCNTKEEAYDIMLENLEIWYEDLCIFPAFDNLVEYEVKGWRSGDSYIRYNANYDKIYGYVYDHDAYIYTTFEIVPVR